MLVSAIQWSVSAVSIHISPAFCTFLLPPPSHVPSSSQNTELSPPCYIAASHELAVVYMVVCVCVCVCVFSRSVVSDSLQPHGRKPSRLLCPWNFPGNNTGASCHFLLQGVFLTQGSNPHLLHLLHWQEDFFPHTTWGSSVCMSVLVSQFAPPSGPLLPCTCIHSLLLCLHSCPASRFIWTIFLGFTYMCYYRILVFLFLTYFILYGRL